MNSIQLKLVACIGFLFFTALLPAQDACHFEVATHQVYGPEDVAAQTKNDIRFTCAMTRTTDRLHLQLGDLYFNMMGTEINLQEFENITELNYYYLWKDAHYQLKERDTIFMDALAETLIPFLLPLTITPDMFQNNQLVILNEGEGIQIDRETLELDSVQLTGDLLSANLKIRSFLKTLWEESLNQAKASPNSTIGEKEITVELPDGKAIITREMVKYGKYFFQMKDNVPEQISFDRIAMPFEITFKDPSKKIINEFSLTIRRIRE